MERWGCAWLELVVTSEIAYEAPTRLLKKSLASLSVSKRFGNSALKTASSARCPLLSNCALTRNCDELKARISRLRSTMRRTAGLCTRPALCRRGLFARRLAELKPDDSVEYLTGLLGGDEVHVDGARVLHRFFFDGALLVISWKTMRWFSSGRAPALHRGARQSPRPRGLHQLPARQYRLL